MGHTTDTKRLEEQIHQSLLEYSTAMTTQAIAETLYIIDIDIKYYITKQFFQVQQLVESDSEEYKNESNNPITAQAKFMVNKKPRFLSPTTLLYHQTPQKLPPTQPLTKSSTISSEETAILQLIGKINKEKQPELAPGEHSSTQTPNPPALISKTPPTYQIMAYQDIAKLEKFFSKEDDTYIWIVEAEKAITANN
ncbi:hypothetical protein G9A89_011677 [Geosiphon pyriformis]|nr:hypothetical protein G9A89_011677 [Geosiphon pyriformis]